MILTLDFETFYDPKDKYSLKCKMNTSEYIRDDRFHINVLAIKRNDEPTEVYFGEQIPALIKSLPWDTIDLLCHNTAFDGFILAHHFQAYPRRYLDTLSMARATHPHNMRFGLDVLAKHHGMEGKAKAVALVNTAGRRDLTPEELQALGEYCKDDVDQTYKLYQVMAPFVPEPEMQLIHMTIRMFCQSKLLVDIPRVQAELERQVGGKVAALFKAGVTAEHLMSNDKFAEVLRKQGVEPPRKVSPTTGKLAYAFAKSDKQFQFMMESHPNEHVRNLCEARLKIKSTIGETRAERLIEAGKDGLPLPVGLNYCGAHTTRWSGGNKLNMQNFPRKGELRKSIIAPPEHVIVVADSAQIEARMLAWLAGQTDVVEAFRSNRDLYSEFASGIFGRPVDRKRKAVDENGNEFFPDEKEGFVGKVCVLGLGYGMSASKLHDTLSSGGMGMKVELPFHVCQTAVDLYRSKNNMIVALWQFANQIIAAMSSGTEGSYKCISWGKEWIQLPNGLFLQYPELRHSRFDNGWSYETRAGRTKIYGGLLVENIIQALARIAISEAMLAIDTPECQVASSTHDEIIAVTHELRADQELERMLKIMSTPPSWAPDVPLKAEGGYDRCYSK